MDTREWIFVLGVIVVVIVALVAAAKWRRQRFEDIGSRDFRADDAEATDELPVGGARTVGYRDPNDIEKMNDEIRARAAASRPRLSTFRPEPVEQQTLLLDTELEDDEGTGDEDEDGDGVPLLLDPSDEHNRDFDESAEAPTDTPEVLPDEDEVRQLQEIADELDAERKEPVIGASPESESRAKTESKSSQKQGDIGEIIIINLMTSPSSPYEGSALFKVLKELGMRHGDMDIFHYCGRHGDEEPQFRMANLLKPGYFQLAEMDNIRTHALCFFYELLPDQDNMKVYESMLSVINKVRDELGGELHDENRSVFTIQTSEHCRNRIRDFQRRHLLDR
ncbi:MAG: cell division protein ZipA [Pseudomonadales bacterium]